MFTGQLTLNPFVKLWCLKINRISIYIQKVSICFEENCDSASNLRWRPYFQTCPHILDSYHSDCKEKTNLFRRDSNKNTADSSDQTRPERVNVSIKHGRKVTNTARLQYPLVDFPTHHVWPTNSRNTTTWPMHIPPEWPMGLPWNRSSWNADALGSWWNPLVSSWWHRRDCFLFNQHLPSITSEIKRGRWENSPNYICSWASI